MKRNNNSGGSFDFNLNFGNGVSVCEPLFFYRETNGTD
jgi:hypothetical protein